MPGIIGGANGESSADSAVSRESWPKARDLRLVRLLGTGQQGTVFLAELEQDRFGLTRGDRVAIKFLNAELLADESAVRRFHDEARTGGRITHPHVIRIWEIEESGEAEQRVVYLVMEYVEGHSLRELLDESGAAIEALTRRIGEEAALGLAALHGEGIVHRDIKPENLCLTTDNRTKVMDLGFATQRRKPGIGSSTSGGVRGSLAYVAPEALRGKPATPASDLYSLGLVLFELATGHHPFLRDPATDPDELIRRSLEETPPPPSALSPRVSAFLDGIVLQLLEKQPHRRGVAAAELASIFAAGERSSFWRERELRAPALASERRLRESRRPSATGWIGRRKHRERIARLWREVGNGEFRAIHCRAPEGIGKRRLIDEFVAERLAARERLTYFATEPAARSRARPFNPLGDILIDHYLDERVGETPTEHQAAKLASRIAGPAGVTEVAARSLADFLLGADAQTAPIDVAARALAAIARPEAPVLLRLHRAELLPQDSVRILEAAQRIGGPMLIVLSSHLESPPAELRRLRHATLPLPYFSERETRDFLRELFTESKEADRAAAQLLAHLTPLPGLLLECLALLAQQGQLSGSPGSYHGLAKTTTFPVATGLRNFLGGAFTRLSEDEQRMLEAAAVLGERFSANDLAALLDENELAVLRRLNPMRDRWLLSEQERMRFKRRSQRRLILDHIDPETRRQLHARAAVILAPTLGTESIAIHWSLAKDHERAIPTLLDAARIQLERDHLERSAELLELAGVHLRDIPRTPPNLTHRVRWLTLRARAALRHNHAEDAQAEIQRALPIARVLDRKLDEGRLRRLMGRTAWERGYLGQAMTWIDSAMPLLVAAYDAGESEAAAEQVKALLLRSYYDAVTGSHRNGLGSVMQAIQLLNDSGSSDPRLRGQTHIRRAEFEAGRLRFENAEEHFKAAADLLREHGDDRGLRHLEIEQADSRLDLGMTRLVRDRMTEILPLLTSPRDRARARGKLATSLHHEGRNPEALDHCLRALRNASQAGDRITELRLASLELGILVAMDAASLERAIAHRQQAENAAMPQLILEAARLEAQLLSKAELAEDALALTETVLDDSRQFGVSRTLQLGLLLEKANAFELLGEAQKARRTMSFGRNALRRIAARIRRPSLRASFLRANPVRRRFESSR